MQAFLRKTVMPDYLFYLMVPMLTVFRNHRSKGREKFLASFYITMHEQVYIESVTKFNERDETEYENFIRTNIDNFVGILTSMNKDLGNHFT